MADRIRWADVAELLGRANARGYELSEVEAGFLEAAIPAPALRRWCPFHGMDTEHEWCLACAPIIAERVAAFEASS